MIVDTLLRVRAQDALLACWGGKLLDVCPFQWI